MTKILRSRISIVAREYGNDRNEALPTEYTVSQLDEKLNVDIEVITTTDLRYALQCAINRMR